MIRWDKNQLNIGSKKECSQGRRNHHPQERPRGYGRYCADIRLILVNRIKVNYFTTQAPALEEQVGAKENQPQRLQ